MAAGARDVRVGGLRPSQILHTYGIGAVVDLPQMSTMVMGLDDWDVARCRRVVEERLLRAVRQRLGEQVERLAAPPMPDDPSAAGSPLDDGNGIGVPVAPFPRWVRCPSCDFLAPLNCGVFQFKWDPYRPEKARFVHEGCRRAGPRAQAPAVLPARFLVACSHGHLDDFPWVPFSHRGKPCDRPQLELRELGASGEAAEVEVHCASCGLRRRLVDAFGDSGRENLGTCRARRPHLRDREDRGCDAEEYKAILLGASNSWFGITLDALALPVGGSPLEERVSRHWTRIGDVPDVPTVRFLRGRGELGDFAGFPDDEVYAAIQARRAGPPAEEADPADLKGPEWRLLTGEGPLPAVPDFTARVVGAPSTLAGWIRSVVLVDRLREVMALLGFTRIDSPADFGDLAELPARRQMPLSRGAPAFVPAVEVRGEGLLLVFREDAVQGWVEANAATDAVFREAHRLWREDRDLTPLDRGYPGLRYVLLHSLAHVLMRQVSLECGYNAASLRERIYASLPDAPEGQRMAGVLIYTAAPDSEGTLGGLVHLGASVRLGRHVEQALERVRLCASDPLCSEHHPHRDGHTLHGAACHACLFVPETSCERGNRYLDRGTLVDTLGASGRGFFGE